MFNDYLANESAKQHIQRRVLEAETYRLHNRIGVTGSQALRRAVAVLTLIGLALAIILLNSPI